MRIRGLALVALLLAIVVAPVAGRAEGCTPGEDGCIPTPEQCSTGDFNGTWGDVGGTGPVAVDFPTGTPVQMRVDFPNLAHVLEAGHRLAVVIGPAGDGTLRWGQPRYTPRLTFGTDGGALASHVVLPVAGGTFGGASPTLSYPPKPFIP